MYSAAPSCTSKALMMITGRMAITRHISSVRLAARLRRQSRRASRRRCSGAKTMPRITAQNTAP
ncbi:hypothetical protein D3C75_1361310 [compost metagenome]